jgi:hypothetical protein
MVILLWVTHWRASIERVALPSVVVGEYPSLFGTLGPDVAGVLFNRFARCGEVAFVFVSVHGLVPFWSSYTVEVSVLYLISSRRTHGSYEISVRGPA